MKAGMVVLSGVMVLSVLGCETPQQKVETPTETEETVPVAAVPELSPPKMKGEVFRVWPYGNGEMMALLGTKDGVRKGDLLMLTRGGDQINAIEVWTTYLLILILGLDRVTSRHNQSGH